MRIAHQKGRGKSAAVVDILAVRQTAFSLLNEVEEQ